MLTQALMEVVRALLARRAAPRPPAAPARAAYVAVALAVAIGPAAAQESIPEIGSGGAATQGEVVIELADAQFGVGSVVRPGDWAGVQLRITDSSPEPREILLRAEGFDPDGDTPVYELVVAASAAASREAWLYLKLPPDFSIQGTLTVEAFEAAPTDDPQRPYRAGDFLGRSILAPRMVLPPTDSMIAVVHRAGSFGLNQYGVAAQGVATWSPLGHERTEVIEQLDAQHLPDRWMGLMPFETIVWGSADPADLGTERPRALIEWVRRGGHLVLVLPAFTQPWTDVRSNPLSGIMPRVTIEPYAAGADLNELLPLLTGRPANDDLQLPEVDASQVVRALRPDAEARPGEAMPIVTDRDGRPLVVRRLEGLGMVTLVGVDLSAPAFRRFALPRADGFWNRVLGRRYEYQSEAALNAEGSTTRRLNILQRNRAPEYYDDDVRAEIATSGRSAAGLLLAFIVFSLYWLIAGPLGFALLKRGSWTRHAWVGFLGAAAAFTAIAWSGAFALRPKQVEARHLSIIDHVYGQGVQRTRSWFSILVPWYGQATLRVGDGGEPSRDGFHNLIAPWSPRAEGTLATRFPDVRPYPIDARSPDEVTFPTRATVKQLQVDWAGEPLAEWRMPRPVLDAGEEGEPELALGTGGRVEGILRHELPAPLEDVYVIAVTRQIRLAAGGSGPIVGGVALKRADSWAPGEEWDLSEIEPRVWEPLANLLDSLVPPPRRALADVRSPLGLEDHLVGLTLFHHLDPPQFAIDSTAEPVVARRWQSHGLDLSPWLTQPVILVVGHMRQAEMPTPVGLGAEGRDFPSNGHVMVRWVYPLEPNPPSWPVAREEGPQQGPESPAG